MDSTEDTKKRESGQEGGLNSVVINYCLRALVFIGGLILVFILLAPSS